MYFTHTRGYNTLYRFSSMHNKEQKKNGFVKLKNKNDFVFFFIKVHKIV